MEDNTGNSSSTGNTNTGNQGGQSQPTSQPVTVERPNTNVTIETHSANDTGRQTK